MKLNNKGEGGFMESMAALMIVIISLTAFISFLAFSISQESTTDNEIPLNILNDVRIVNGEIEADIEEKMLVSVETNGYAGMRVILSAAGIYDSSKTLNVGRQDSDAVNTRAGTIIVRTDDGRSVPVNYTMAVWS